VSDIGNRHNIFGRDRACGSGDILADRQTDRHTHHNTSHFDYNDDARRPTRRVSEA